MGGPEVVGVESAKTAKLDGLAVGAESDEGGVGVVTGCLRIGVTGVSGENGTVLDCRRL